MTEKEILEVFNTLGLNVDPLPRNYNPDSYGKSLIANTFSNQGVYYSCSSNEHDSPASEKEDLL